LAYQDVPPSPGRPAAPGAPAGEAHTAQPAPGDAPPSAGGEPSGLAMLAPLLLLLPLLLLMFFSTRSQQKKQQAAIASLKKGDRVLTQGGFVGKLVEVGDRYAKVELAPGVKVEVLKTGLLGRDTAETAAAVEKK
jgi:preprotein translocase subunit YajC